MERIVAAPEALDLEHRVAFRREAEAELDRLPGRGVLVIDLSATTEVDSAGLGALVMIQRYAVAGGRSVRLRGLSAEVKSLLTLSRLLELFR